ncbi:hypothetical protein QE152_g23211 [Popillia japonica]|uniref:Uncharacterized protein n=1 Tax=Popillia japonica TaxID=7064 RepID=A0AAW1KI83_POPJA
MLPEPSARILLVLLTSTKLKKSETTFRRNCNVLVEKWKDKSLSNDPCRLYLRDYERFAYVNVSEIAAAFLLATLSDDEISIVTVKVEDLTRALEEESFGVSEETIDFYDNQQTPSKQNEILEEESFGVSEETIDFYDNQQTPSKQNEMI